MPTCVECGQAVPDLYREFSKGNIRLTQCHNCQRFADRYVEYELVLLVIDLILLRPQVYRHLLFNRIPYHDRGIDKRLAQMAIGLVLIDVYVRAAYLDGLSSGYVTAWAATMTAMQVFACTVLELVCMYAGVLVALRYHLGDRYVLFKYNYVVMGMILSSFAKTTLLLMLIWDYDTFTFSWMVQLFVLISNAEAMSVILCESYWRAAALVLVGVVCKLAAQTCIHLAFGLPIWLFY